jgi:hypothetical protein
VHIVARTGPTAMGRSAQLAETFGPTSPRLAAH